MCDGAVGYVCDCQGKAKHSVFFLLEGQEGKLSSGLTTEIVISMNVLPNESDRSF